MIKRFYILLLAIVASVGMGWATENSIVINGTPQVGDNSISLTYYFDPANVPGITGYAPTLKVKCVTDNIWDEQWLSLSEISSGTTTITLNELGSFQEGKSYDVCFAYYNGSWVDDVFQSFTPAAPTPAVIDLATITSDYVIPDGTTLTGTLGTNVKITIAAGATVTLNGVDINSSGTWTGGDYAGITCPGNATIILADGTVNRIKGFLNGNSAIHIKPNYTLTIEGDGTLYASTQGGAAAIGCGYSDSGGSRNGGNIVINGGTIYADGGSLAAGIGGGGRATIGNITINGGIIYAVGGGTGAGIGGGQSKSNSWKSICGNITISSNVKYLKATKGSGAAHSIGKGSSSYSVCGTVTIPGGATGYVSTSPYVYCNPDYVIELINAIPQPVVYTDECKAAIDEARAMYTALTDDQKTSVTNYSTLTDAEAAYAALPVEDKIAAIGTVEYTAESKALIDAARTAYDALSDEAKALVTNYSTLTDAETAYAALIQAGADAVTAKIAAIPQPVELKLATRDSINNARAAYDALTADQQALVTNYDVLTAAEATMAGLNPGGGAPSTELQGDGSTENPYLIGGLEAWNAFADAVAAGVKPANAKLTNNIEGVTRMVGNNTNYYTGVFDGNGFTITMNIETNLDSAGLFRCVKEATFMNLNLEGTFTTSRKFAGSLVGAQLSINTLVIKNVCSSVAMTLSLDGDLTSGGIVGLRLGTIQITDCLFKGSMTSTGGGSMCGGIVGYSSSNLTLVRVIQAGTYNLNTSSYDGVFVRNNDANLNAQNCYYINGVGGQSTCAAATQITTDQLNTQTYVDLLQTGKEDTYWVLKDGVLVWNHHETSSLSPLDSAQAVKDLIEAIPMPVTLEDACVNAIHAAQDAYNALRDEVKGALDAATVNKLNQAITDYTALIQAGADAVTAKIAAIPLPVELKLATRDSIESARAAYDALTADQQALVTNYQTLLDAEDALADLNPGVPPATPLDSAQAVKDLIDAIPQPVEYPTSGAAIAAALNAFNQLSDAAKGALDDADVQKMTDAAAQYAALDAIAAIDAIPAEIVYDPAVKAAIETAREKYDALIDASKAYVGEDKVHKLTNAEEAWAILVAKVEHNVSYMGKDGELKNEKVALLHIPDPAPEFNGYEFVRWDVKAGDFLEEGLRIKAVYTPIITTKPVAYDSLMYNGMAQTLITAGVAKEGHIEYRINDGEWSAELPQATFAAAYVVYYKLVREGHEDYLADSIVSIIAKAPVAYTAPTAVESLVYTASNQTLIAAGQTNDGTFEYSLDPTLLDSWKAELPQAKDADTYSVYYRVQGDLNHLDSVAATPVAVTIAKAELTATADDKNVIYGDAVPAYTITYAGWQGDDDATVLTGELAFACTYASTSNVGNYTITPSGVDAANYTITFVNGKVTVAKAALMITAEDKNVTYGDAVPEYTATYSGWKNTDGASVVSGLIYTCEYAPTSNVGDYTITPSGATATNYNISYTNGKVTVAQAALMITAEDKNVTYGDAVPEYTATYSGWKNSDDASVVSGLVYTCEYAPTSNVGEYTITPSGATATNYNISYTNGKVTVAKAALMITAENKSVIYGDAVPTYTATYSGWKNSDDASVVSNLAYTCEYAPTSNVGEYTITPNSATAQNYAISYTNGKVTVAQATLTVTAENKTVTYGDAAPAFTATYSGWKNTDDASVVSGLAYSCIYAPGSYIGTYAINPNSATAQNYAITFIDGTLTVNRAVVYVSDAEAQIAKFVDGHTGAVVLKQGTLNGIKLNDPIAHVTTAAFSSADVSEHLTITLYYELTGDAALLTNYNLTPTSEIFSTEGVIIEQFIPDEKTDPEDPEAQVEEGIEIYAYGYCEGSSYSLRYHLESGKPDQYKIEFADPRFTDVDWTDLEITGPDGIIDIDVPVEVPTGDYTFVATFRDSRFPWLESKSFEVTFHVNLPETYIAVLFNNVIAVVDTCECLTDIQWYHRNDASEIWQPIEGATGYYYRQEGGLTGEYFVSAKMNGMPTYTCPQEDMKTLYGEGQLKAPQVKAYPNPVQSTTNVTIENSLNFEHSLRIVDFTGHEMQRMQFEGNETIVDMNGYPQGNYMISVDGIVVKVLKK